MPLANLTILAVDDNEAHNYALCHLLEKQGHCEVVSACTGQQALDFAATKRLSAILLDVNLPDVNGWEVCRRLRKDPKLDRVPIVFITATFQSSAAKDMARSVGANNLLFHPVETDHLFAIIRGEIARIQTNQQ